MYTYYRQNFDLQTTLHIFHCPTLASSPLLPSLSMALVRLPPSFRATSLGGCISGTAPPPHLSPTAVPSLSSSLTSSPWDRCCQPSLDRKVRRAILASKRLRKVLYNTIDCSLSVCSLRVHACLRARPPVHLSVCVSVLPSVTRMLTYPGFLNSVYVHRTGP